MDGRYWDGCEYCDWADKVTRLYLPTKTLYYVTQVFGVNPQNYKPYAGHMGIDYGTPVGVPIYASADGVITETPLLTSGYGRHIKMKIANDIVLVYGHLSQCSVVVGQTVKAKEYLGLTGGSKSDPYCGYSTGPHLHYEVRVPGLEGNGYGGAVDPMPYLIMWEEVMTDKPVLYTGTVSVGSSKLLVRKLPVNGSVIGSFITGQRVEVVDTRKVGTTEWLQIKWLGEAWVSGDYVVRDPVVEPGTCPDLKPVIEALKNIRANLDVLDSEMGEQIDILENMI